MRFHLVTAEALLVILIECTFRSNNNFKEVETEIKPKQQTRQNTEQF